MSIYSRLVNNTLKWASLVAQMVKNHPAMQDTWVQPLGGEDPLEEGMATHSSILAWRIPMDRVAWWATGSFSWDFPGKNTGLGCHFLLQGIFLTQGLNPGLPHCRQIVLSSEPSRIPTIRLSQGFRGLCQRLGSSSQGDPGT